MDDADKAGIEIEREQERLLEAARRKTRARSDRCIDCGDALPPCRQEWELCIPCAEDRERLKRIAGVRR